MENNEFKLLMKARENIYNLLRCFFLQEPNEEFFVAVEDENILRDLKGYNKDLDEGVELVSSTLLSPNRADLTSALVEEFTRLFVGPISVPLHESVYRSEAGLILPEETLTVQQKYLEAGLFIHPDASFPEDHIGAELEFIYYLCQKAAQAEEEEEQKALLHLQRDFLRDHLGMWIRPFCEHLFDAARSPYFQGIAKITHGFITWDCQEIVAHFDE